MERLLIWFTAIGLVAVALAAVIGLNLPASGSNLDFTALAPETLSLTRWAKGNEEAKIILTEFSDFQCPACGAYYPIMKKVAEDFGDRVKFSYRHFPLKDIHPNSELAARVAEEAGLQGKFWEMHDVIFENQELWSASTNARQMFLTYAGVIGLDADRLEADIDSPEVADKVESDYQTGFTLQVFGTPTFFLNGVKLTPNPRSYDEFKIILETALKQAA